MTEIVAGIVMFTAVVLMLVAMLLVAKRKLVAHGDVRITINEDPDKAFKVAAGGTLLGTLADNKIFIPSACGGKGACGVCEVVVKEGGGDLLPTETSFISRGEAKRGHRLACQVKVLAPFWKKRRGGTFITTPNNCGSKPDEAIEGSMAKGIS